MLCLTCKIAKMKLRAALVPDGETLSATRTRTLPDSAQQWPALIADGTITLPRPSGRSSITRPIPNGRRGQKTVSGASPISVMTTPLRLSEQRFGSVRRAYIECTEDHAVPIAAQRAMQKVLPCEPVITLETDHAPFYSKSRSVDVSPALHRTLDAGFQSRHRLTIYPSGFRLG